MFKEEYSKMYKLEENHWYFFSKRIFIKNLISRIDLSHSSQVLDIGCGTGINLKELFINCDYTGVDINPDAIEFCKLRGLKNILQQDIDNLSFKKDCFDCVSAFDVLYHKKIDIERVLKKIKDILKPSGYLIITDCAFNFLMSEHDISMEARERFTKKTLAKYLDGAGLRPIYFSYAFAYLFPIVAFVRLLKKPFFLGKTNDNAVSDVKEINSVINDILIKINSLEAWQQKWIPSPFGSTILCIAKKE